MNRPWRTFKDICTGALIAAIVLTLYIIALLKLQ